MSGRVDNCSIYTIKISGSSNQEKLKKECESLINQNKKHADLFKSTIDTYEKTVQTLGWNSRHNSEHVEKALESAINTIASCRKTSKMVEQQTEELKKISLSHKEMHDSLDNIEKNIRKSSSEKQHLEEKVNELKKEKKELKKPDLLESICQNFRKLFAFISGMFT